jgi:hypothetical protein
LLAARALAHQARQETVGHLTKDPELTAHIAG